MLALIAGPLILAVGAVSIAAGVAYTGGPKPYGYEGLGELFVFLFFGLVAVNGSYYVQVEKLAALPAGLSIAVGLLAAAILVVNNVRDIETDRRAGKRTLAVRIGRRRARALYAALVRGCLRGAGDRAGRARAGHGGRRSASPRRRSRSSRCARSGRGPTGRR